MIDMGMYNEVYKRCPRCGKMGYMQISQIVLGFGNFNLDNPDSLSELSESNLVRLHERVKEGQFQCGGAPGQEPSGSCDLWFTLEEAIDPNQVKDRRTKLLKELFGC